MISLGSRPSLIRNVRVVGPSAPFVPFDGPVDLVIANGRVADIGPAGALKANGELWDADGRWVIPGLWDHHVHLSPWALRSTRTDLGAVESAQAAARVMSDVRPDAQGIRIGIGYRDALWPDHLEDVDLDAITGSVPTYMVNADLHSVWVNSAAAARSGAPGAGVYREAPAFAIHSALDRIPEHVLDMAIAEAADSAASRGVVGIVDLDFPGDITGWQRRAEADFDAVRVSIGVYPENFSRTRALGFATGDALDDAGLLRIGALKIITDGSLGTGTAACSHPYGAASDTGILAVQPRELHEHLIEAAQARWEVAVHAIGDRAVSHALDAFAATGAVGSMEHAQLVAASDLHRFARLNVTASVQPAHALDDRDLVDRDWAAQTAISYPMRSLVDAGANVVFGSDAPVSPLRPWDAIADAVTRMRGGADAWRAEEAVDVTTALAASSGLGSAHDSLVLPGVVADLAFCDTNPYTADGTELREMRVGATLMNGGITHIG